MKYKGYTALTEIDEDAGIIFGRVVGLRDVITFQGETVAEARKSFEESVDFYLEMCAERGEPAEKPFSGKFVLRLEPELHRTLAVEAEVRKTSLNALVEEAIGEFLGKSTMIQEKASQSNGGKPKVPVQVSQKDPLRRASKK